MLWGDGHSSLPVVPTTPGELHLLMLSAWTGKGFDFAIPGLSLSCGSWSGT